MFIALVWYAFGLVALGLFVPQFVRFWGYAIFAAAAAKIFWVHDTLIMPSWYWHYMTLVASWIFVASAVLVLVQRFGDALKLREAFVVKAVALLAVAFLCGWVYVHS